MGKINLRKGIAGLVAVISVVSSLNIPTFALNLNVSDVETPEITRVFVTPTPSTTSLVSPTPTPTKLPSSTPTPIKVNGKKNIKHTLSGAFTLPENGTNEKEVTFLFDISGNGGGSPTKAPTPFDSALFSGGGQDLVIQGGSQVIKGKVHSNGLVTVASGEINCYVEDEFGNKKSTGLITSVTDYDPEDPNDPANKGKNPYSGDLNMDLFLWDQPVQLMPDYVNEILQSDIVSKGAIIDFIEGINGNPITNDDLNNYFNKIQPPFEEIENPQNLKEGLLYLRRFNPKVNLNINDGKLQTTGQDAFVVPDDTIIRIGTSLIVHNNGIEFKGTGFLIADYDIVLMGGKIITSSKDTQGKIISDADKNAGAFIYSRKGNIAVNTSDSEYYGIFYAPNGKVDLKGNNVKVYGSVVGKELGSIPGDLYIEHATGTAEQKIQPPAPKTYFELAKDSVKAYIDSIKSDESSYIRILTYDEVSSDVLCEGDAITDKDELFEGIEKIKVINNNRANLGDGIRKSTNAFDKSKASSKSIVVISGSEPNRWLEDDLKQYYFGNDDKDSHTIVDFNDNGNTGTGYAEKAIKKAVQLNVATLFFNYLDDEKPDPNSTLPNPPMIINDQWVKADAAIRKILDSVILSNPKLFDNVKGIKEDDGLITPDDFYKTAHKDENLTKLINDTLSTFNINYSMNLEAEFYCLLPEAVTVKEADLPDGFVSAPVGKRTKITLKKKVTTTLTGVLNPTTNKISFSVDGNTDLKVIDQMLLKDLKFLYNKNFIYDKNTKNRIETRVFTETDAYIKFKIKSVTGYQNTLSINIPYKELTLYIKYVVDLN